MAACGVRLIAAGTGGDGGIDQIPRMAKLAAALGFRVISLIDRDKESADTAGQLTKIQEYSDVVIRLPEGHAVEKATFAGVVARNRLAAAEAVLPDAARPVIG